jgi:hypothetical protein
MHRSFCSEGRLCAAPLVVMLGVAGVIRQVPGHPRWMALVGLLLPLGRLARGTPRAATRIALTASHPLSA